MGRADARGRAGAAEGPDLDLLGFDSEEIDKLLDVVTVEEADTDVAPEPPVVPVSKPVDLWICGNHRVLCGNATVLADVERALDGRLADMVLCDPPYNVDYGNTAKDKLRGKGRPILNDNLGEGFEAFLYDACVNLLTVTKGAVYICMSSSELDTLQKAFRRAGGHWSTFIIWAKNTFTLGRADYQGQYEPILYGWKEGTDRFWCGARDQGDVWFVDKPVKNDLHPTMKPLGLVERAIRNSSKSRDLVLDPFGGSGSTLIAAERSGRSAALVGLDPAYVDVIVRRRQQVSGESHARGRRSAFRLGSATTKGCEPQKPTEYQTSAPRLRNVEGAYGVQHRLFDGIAWRPVRDHMRDIGRSTCNPVAGRTGVIHCHAVGFTRVVAGAGANTAHPIEGHMAVGEQAGVANFHVLVEEDAEVVAVLDRQEEVDRDGLSGDAVILPAAVAAVRL
jgi:DNA modification methylase